MKQRLKENLGNIAQKNPILILISVYSLIAIAGFLFLCLPFSQKVPVSLIDHLFIATSAVSTTGLTSVSVCDSYTFLGQIVILLLIQIGGLHYMSFGSMVMLMGRKKLSKFHEDLVKTDFGLPDDFDIYEFTRSVILFSLLVEAIGAAFLYVIFRQSGVEQPLWNAIFHSISAFCTAGFSLFNNSFENFVSHPLLNIVICALSILGAVGFIVVTDYWQVLTKKKVEVTLTTKIIMVFTVSVIAAGTVLLLLSDSLLSDVAWADKFWICLFQSMSAMTTVGFNTFPVQQMSHSALYLMVILMLVGASPAGTGGGIKSTTVVAVMVQMVSTLRGKRNVTFLGHQIPPYRLRLAAASFTFYIVLLAGGTYLLNVVDGHSVFEVIFEAASALGTVGLSMGITGTLSFMGKLVVILMMMLGRIGPLSIGLAMFYKKDEPDDLGWQEDIVIG